MPPALIRDLTPTNAENAVHEAALAERRFEYLLARRDQASDRLRTGGLALNGSSIVALIAALGGEGQAATWLGLNAGNTAAAATFFVVGTLAAGVALQATTNKFVEEAGDAFSRMVLARRYATAHFAPDSPRARDEAEAALKELTEAPLVDFQYSKVGLWAQNVSAGAWLGGICVPLGTALHLW